MNWQDIRLPAEWEPQDAVLLSWPHEETDWADVLTLVEPVYIDLVREMQRFARVLLVAPDVKRPQRLLKKAGVDTGRVSFFEIDTNDTWVRDYGPVTVESPDGPVMLDFTFNAWGMKFAAGLDNQVSRKLYRTGVFKKKADFRTLNMVLEGGGIESDGEGTIMLTRQCFLEANRNPQWGEKKIEKRLMKYLGARRFLWLSHGALEGDDTDSHIDTLARFAPGGTIVYVECTDKKDPHYHELHLMKKELESFRQANGEPYRLLPLPMARAAYDGEGRLPSTYANFLVLNNGVLMPAYQDEKLDREAAELLAEAFPGREIVPVQCLPLVLQHGSLHCATMQLPEGTVSI